MLVRPDTCIKSCTFKPETEPKQDVTKEKIIYLSKSNKSLFLYYPLEGDNEPQVTFVCQFDGSHTKLNL